MNNSIEVTGLSVYPIKSCAGIALEQAEIVRTGFAYDRTWVLIDSQGEIVTQRKSGAQQLALVRPELSTEGVHVYARSEAERLFLPFEYSADGPIRELQVWGSRCRGREESAQASAWFSRVLGSDVRLLRFERGFERVVDPATVGNALARAEFQDGYPLLVIAEESLEALNRMLSERGAPTVEMSRFRPNIILRGMGAFGEDAAAGLERISNPLLISFPKRCSRCVMVNVDQRAGEMPQLPREQHPLSVLSQTRMFEDSPGKRKPGFGQNAVVENFEVLPQRIALGDRFRARQ